METLTLAAIASAVLNLFQWIYRINVGRLSKRLDDLLDRTNDDRPQEDTASKIPVTISFKDSRTSSGGCMMGKPPHRAQKKCLECGCVRIVDKNKKKCHCGGELELIRMCKT